MVTSALGVLGALGLLSDLLGVLGLLGVLSLLNTLVGLGQLGALGDFPQDSQMVAKLIPGVFVSYINCNFLRQDYLVCLLKIPYLW